MSGKSVWFLNWSDKYELLILSAYEQNEGKFPTSQTDTFVSEF